MKSVACSSTTRCTSSEARFDVMPEISASSAATATGCVICHPAPCLPSVVFSPSAGLTVTWSILSDCTSAKTFSCFFSGPPSSCFDS